MQIGTNSFKIEDVLEIPNSLENIVKTEAYKWVGRVYNIHFEGASIHGNATLARYSRSKASFHIGLWPPRIMIGWKLDYRVTDGTRSTYLIEFGKKVTRHSGYKRDLVGRLANNRLSIPDETLDAVFGQIDKELIKLYRKVFPEANQTIKIASSHGSTDEGTLQSIEGTVIEVSQTFLQPSEKAVTLYRIQSDDTIEYNVGLSGHYDNINEGDRIRVRFDRNNIIGTTSLDDVLEVIQHQFEVIPTTINWYKVVGYTRIN
ncbi:hypothetical protein HYX00_04020 [Candidatus Woesearchaeota archaeon]|nr:hypothetical protein [Candidatus Woesearchaeota archaeon]